MPKSQNPLIRKSKPERLGQMSESSWDSVAEIISKMLTKKLDGLQTVQVVTLYTTGMKTSGVLALLDKLLQDVSAFGILEGSWHYGAATDENLSPTQSVQMRMVMWNSELSAVSEFCHLYSSMVEVSHDYILRAATGRDTTVAQAIEWIARYAKSPMANYEGQCDPDSGFKLRPNALQLEYDDLYKVPCYRWRMRRKHLDDRTARARPATFMLGHRDGIRVKEAALNHPKWP
jgi:hypothetical protein